MQFQMHLKRQKQIEIRFILGSGGDDGVRTHGPHVANVMLSQLSYIPTGFALLARR